MHDFSWISGIPVYEDLPGQEVRRVVHSPACFRRCFWYGGSLGVMSGRMNGVCSLACFCSGQLYGGLSILLSITNRNVLVLTQCF